MRVRNNHCLLKHFFSFEARKVLVNNSPRETLNMRNRCLQTVFSLWSSYIYKMVFEICNDHRQTQNLTFVFVNTISYGPKARLQFWKAGCRPCQLKNTRILRGNALRMNRSLFRQCSAKLDHMMHQIPVKWKTISPWVS